MKYGLMLIESKVQNTHFLADAKVICIESW